MANIFDYLNDVAYDSFYDLPVNELDVLALTELTYLAFDDVVTLEPKRLIDLAPQIPRDTTMLTNKNRLQLLDQLSQHKRFKNCKLSDFINDIDPELQKQFAAMTYRISLDTYLLVFRGTDDSLSLIHISVVFPCMSERTAILVILSPHFLLLLLLVLQQKTLKKSTITTHWIDL